MRERVSLIDILNKNKVNLTDSRLTFLFQPEAKC